MTKLRLHFVMLVLFGCGVSATAAGATLGPRAVTLLTLGLRSHKPPRSAAQQVLRLEDQIRQALLSGDTAVLDKVLADDFLGVSANGTLSDKQQYLRRIAKHEHHFSQIDVTDRKIRVQNASAVVVTTADVTGNLDGSRLQGVYRYTRVWSREPDGSWKLRNFEATRVSGASGDGMNHGVPVARTN